MSSPMLEVPPSVADVSVASLVGLADLGPSDYADHDEGAKYTFASIQLGILQRMPRPHAHPIYHQLAAQYLPALTEKFRTNDNLLSIPMLLINSATYTPYFARFMSTPAAEGLAATETKRIAQVTDALSAELEQEQVAETGQWYAMLLIFQGHDGIDEGDKAGAVARLSKWKQQYNGTFAEETMDRCLGALSNDRGEMGYIIKGMKVMLEAPLTKCGGGKGVCKRSMDDGKEPLSKCSRCKTTVYCGAPHQQAGWKEHKPLCFASAF